MQAIITTFKGPTNTRGARVLVKSWNAKTTHYWEYALGSKENHEAAIAAHIEELNEKAPEFQVKQIALGASPDDSGYVAIVE